MIRPFAACRRVRSSAAIAFLSFVSASGAFAQYDLAAPRAFPTGANPATVVSGDFDGDGRRDLAIAESAGVRLVSFRDDELFASASAFELPQNPTALDAGDADGDELADLLVAASGGVQILFGDGAGGFERANVLGLPETIRSASLADMNGDGLLDVVSSLETLGAIAVSIQDPESPRRFLAPVSTSVTNGIARLAVGDFDGDGLGDVVQFEGVNSRFVLRAGVDGGGALRLVGTKNLMARHADSAVADLDGDGLDDLVVATDATRLEVFRGDAASGLVESSSLALGSGEGATAVAVTDLDGDGLLDFVAALLKQRLAVFRGDGHGGGGAAHYVPLGLVARDLHAAFLTDDGDVDLVVTSAASRVAAILPGVEGGGLVAVKRLARVRSPFGGIGDWPTGVAAGDWNDDGLPDLAGVGFANLQLSDRVAIFFGDGRGGVAAEGVAPLRDPPVHLASGDVDGDGRVDLAVTSLTGDGVALFRATGSGFFDAGDVIATDAPLESILFDLDADGASDVATISRSMNSVEVAWNEGGGTFLAPSSFFAGGTPSSFAVADWDGDGLVDFLVTHGQQPGLAIIGQSPVRSFGSVRVLSEPLGPFPTAAAAQDLDGDGAVDWAFGDSSEGTIRIAFGDGAGGVARRAALAAPGPTTALRTVDVTGDGAPDLLAASASKGTLAVLEGDGRGGFAAARVFASGAGSSGIDVVDWDGDGRTDVAVAAKDADTLAVLAFRDTPVTACLAGTVNAAGGSAANVLFVNSTAGDFARRVRIGSAAPCSILVNRPPLGTGSAPFALYLWRGEPTRATLRDLPEGLGRIAFPMPLSPGEPAPRVVWNNAGHFPRLGAPTQPSTPAPSFPLIRPQGLGRTDTFTLQGVITDPGAPNGIAAVTNGIVLEVR